MYHEFQTSAHEFQAVILAGGTGQRLSPLTEHIPKPLLPIKNQPMIHYQLRYLHENGFKSVAVVTIARFRDGVHEAVRKFQAMHPGMEVELRACADTGSADGLRVLRDWITRDFIVLACDTITNIPLVGLGGVLHHHRKKNSTCTIVLKQTAKKDGKDEKKKSDDTKGPSVKSDKFQTEYTGIDPEGRVELFLSSGEIDGDALMLKKLFVLRRQNMTLSTTWQDVHMYVMPPWILEWLDTMDSRPSQMERLTSVKHELIPILVNQQHRRIRDDGTWGDMGYVIPRTNPVDVVDMSNLMDLTLADSRLSETFTSGDEHEIDDDRAGHSQMELFQTEFGRDLEPLLPKNPDALRCFTYVAPPECFCARAHYLSHYFDINKQLLKRTLEAVPSPDTRVGPPPGLPPRVQIGEDCLIGDDFQTKEAVTIKASIVGHGVVLGTKVRVVNTVLMDGVVVGDGCNLSNCLVASTRDRPTIIGDGCILKDCQIEAGYKVEEDATGEQMVVGWDV